jgi:co-chaperonin GroES (HSP10)
VRTLEALAWALHLNGQSSAARKEIDKVLAVGVTQPVTFYRAAAMAVGQGDAARAKEYATRSIGMCGTSAVAGAARDVLAQLSTTT